MINHRLLNVGRVTVGLAVTMAFSLSSTGSPTVPYPVHVVTSTAVEGLRAPLGADCSVQCSQGLCGHQEHVALDGQPNNLREGGSHSLCATGTCEEKHPFCGDTFAYGQLETLRADLLNNDANAIAAWVRDHSAEVEVNPERGALQVLGCEGKVLLHVALTPQMLAFLAEQ